MTRKNKEISKSIIREMEKKALELGIISRPLTVESKTNLEISVANIDLVPSIQESPKTRIKRDMEKAFAKARKELDAYPYIKTILEDAVRPSGSLKPRLDHAVKRMEIQIKKLDKAADRFSDRDKSIFTKIVNAYTKHDMTRANVFANELDEKQKMEKMIMHSRLALEQIVLRLSTVSELGDVVSTLAPAVNVLRSVKNGLSTVFPEAEREIGSIGNLLSGIIMDAGYNTGMSLNFQSASDDAQKILKDATTIAKAKAKEKFPILPINLSFSRTREKIRE